jgi:hypothetical protein
MIAADRVGLDSTGFRDKSGESAGAGGVSVRRIAAMGLAGGGGRTIDLDRPSYSAAARPFFPARFANASRKYLPV